MRPISSPATNIGTPCERKRIAAKFLICRSRSALTPGSSVWPFDAAVPAQVVVDAVAVALAVRLVVLVVVGDEVVEREAVVRGDEVDAVRRAAAAALVDVRAAGDARGDRRRSRPRSPRTKRRTSSRKRAVPLRPARARELADVVEAARVPRPRRSPSCRRASRTARCPRRPAGTPSARRRRRGAGSSPRRSGSRRRASPRPSSAGSRG